MFGDTVIHDYAVLIGAVGLLILAIAVAVVLFRRQVKTVTASFGEVSGKIDMVQATADKVNTAVNNVPEGQHTLVERVGHVEDGQRWLQTALMQIATQVGVTLPQPPQPPIRRWYQ